MLNLLLEPLDFEFMRNALFTAIMLGVLCSVVGSYLIVQRMGLLGDVIAHAVLPGLAIAFFLVSIFSIVLVVSSLFVLALLLSPSQGILTRPDAVKNSARIFRSLKRGE